MKSLFFRKIIWAVNAFDDVKIQAQAAFVVGALTRATGAEVIPTHVLNPPYTRKKRDGAEGWEVASKATAEKQLKDLSTRSEIGNITSAVVLCNRSNSTRASVRCLTDYAEDQDADVIVVATHARAGVPRVFAGSFAETLVLNSTIPVITVNPESKPRERVSKILFPTTFQSRFRESFERVIQLAKSLDASVTLLYKEPFVSAYHMTEEIYRYIAQESVGREKRAKEWQDWANHYGVATALHLDNTPGYLINEIENHARANDFDLIAMATEADSVSAAIVGSATRQIMRTAPCAVWALKVDHDQDEDEDE